MILHIDMDAFFAAIEQRDNPELKGVPVIISRDHKRGVVATASYEARKFGIHSAMPVFMAKQRCGNLTIVPGNMKKYKAVSLSVMEILSSFSPLLEQVSIDEAYLDISGCERLFGTPEEIGMSIKKKIKDRLVLTCSIGIAPVRFLAKIASDMQKPDGLTLIKKSEMNDFIKNLAIEKVPGVGKRAMDQMVLLKIETLSDIKKYSLSILTQKFGSMGKRLFELANGVDSTGITKHAVRKSISSETTLTEDISDFETIKQIILDRSQTVGRQLRKKNSFCSIIFIKIKFADFTQITRQKKINHPVSSSNAIFNNAVSLFKKIQLKKKIRLIGVGVSALKDKHSPVQLLLTTTENKQQKQWDHVDSAMDRISEKYGSTMVTKATLRDKNKQRSQNGKHNH